MQAKTVYTRRDETKQLRIRRKQARVEENEERKRWVRRQLVQHTYGDAEEYGDQADDDEGKPGDLGRSCGCGNCSRCNKMLQMWVNEA